MKKLYNEIKNQVGSLKITSLLVGILLVLVGSTKAQDKLKQEDLNVIKGNWLRFSDAPNALYHYLVSQANDFLNQRYDQIDDLKSLSDWKARQQSVRRKLQEVMGSFPEKTTLNARVVKIIKKKGYRVEHIIYESQPGLYVTSSLFIPNGLSGKSPVVIYCSGHSAIGYRDPTKSQHRILNLVNKGFIVFAFDPIGQGERMQYFDAKTGKSTIGGPTLEHSYPGSQVFISGGSLARYMIWDGIRAIDYLCSRKEVDPERIGINGLSGGGTQSAYIAAFDDRIKATAPGNYVTNFTRLLESIGPQDAEQNFFNGIQRGLDHADLLEVRAPKPAFMITTTRDFFSIQGARETAQEVSRVYNAYNEEGNFGKVEDDAPHASTQKNRQGMYAFFQKALNNPGDSVDKEIEPLSAEEMQVTKTGQVSTSLGGETIFSLNRKASEVLVEKLRSAYQNHGPQFLSTLVSSAKELSGYHEPMEKQSPVFTGRFQQEGYVIEKYFVKGEGNYPIPYLLMKPDKPNHKALLYLNPSGKSAEALTGGEMEWFVKQGFVVVAPDLLGFGEMGPGDFRGDAYIANTSFNTWYASMQIGRSIVGIQAGDVIRLVRLLKEDKAIDEVYGLARKQAAPLLLHAAAFEPLIKRVALIEPYSSYRSIVMNRSYQPLFIPSTVPGALKAYDLPYLSASLAPRKLMMVGTTDGNGEFVDREGVDRDLDIIRSAYRKKESDKQLIILREGSEGMYKRFIEE